jgi:hypothetical protein
MTNLNTLADVWNQVETRSMECWDSLIPVEDMRFESLEHLRIGSDSHALKPVAQREMAYRLGVPITYLQRCDPDVQAYNLNHWMKKERNDELFLRFNGNDVRAVFTPKYKPVDNKDILKTLEAMGMEPETRVQAHLDEDFLSLNIPDEKGTYAIQRNDRVQPGVSISNSEVGLSSLTVTAFILRLLCTNGLITADNTSMSYRHISERILGELPSIIQGIKNNVESQQRLWSISLQSLVADPVSTINAFNRQFNVTNRESEAVDWAWPQEQGDTMFNIINTYTKAAHYPSLAAEQIHHLQKTGGQILSLLN